MTSTEQLKELIQKIWEKPWLIDFYIQESASLSKKDTTVRICDFDDTLFSREEQLSEEPILKEKRGAEGNSWITNIFGIHNFTQKYYADRNLPQEIQSLLHVDSDLILTAWLPELQELKIRNAGLTKYKLKIVSSWEDKILETIRYILFELRYIPSEIIIYEDRPQFFIEYRELIEWVLWCKLTIMYIEMDGNTWYKKIEGIK